MMTNYSYREWQRKPDTDRLGFTIFKLICDNTKSKDFSLRHCISRITPVGKDSR